MAELLRAQELTRGFGGLVAVDRVSLSVESGEIRGVIGPNGAGKSTLFNLLTGLTRPTSGRIWFNGRDITGQPLFRMVSLGIARTFQNLQVCQGLTVLDNIVIGTHHFCNSGVLGAVFRSRRVRQSEAEAREIALQALQVVGLKGREQELVGNLSFGHRKMLEIARAMASRPRLLLVDEPAAGLNDREKQELAGLLSRIRDQGITVLLVEHDMRLVMRLCDRITVLDYGRKIAEDTPQRVQANPEVIRAYLGAEADQRPQGRESGA